MVERLPKDCYQLLDCIAKSISKDACLGVGVRCTPNGKNKFTLKVEFCSPLKIYYLIVTYDNFAMPDSIVTIPALGKIFNEAYPDFLLKNTSFVSFDKLVNGFKLDKERIAVETMKRVRAAFTKNLTNSYRNEGVKIYLAEHPYGNGEPVTSAFKSFSEFLVWADLNVK